MHWELHEAEEWILKLPTADEGQRRAFVTWIKASPKNLKAFLLSTTAVTEIKRKLPQQPGHSLPRAGTGNNILKFPVRASAQVCGSPGIGPADRRVPSKPLRWMSTAASVSVALLIAHSLPQYFAGTVDAEFATDVGETHTFRLPDGTFLQLNTNSRVTAHYTVRQRDVYLERGEIWVNVADDRQRPFRVLAGRMEVRDIGTAFDVRVSPDETTVYVLKGRVRLSAVLSNTTAATGSSPTEPYSPSLEIGGGNEAVIKTAGDGTWKAVTARRLTSQESGKRTAWTRGVLMFTGEPLLDVVREVNRYQERRIVVVDPQLQKVSVGGTIDPTDHAYRAILGFLRASVPHCAITVDSSDPSTIQLRIDKRLGCRSDD